MNEQKIAKLIVEKMGLQRDEQKAIDLLYNIQQAMEDREEFDLSVEERLELQGRLEEGEDYKLYTLHAERGNRVLFCLYIEEYEAETEFSFSGKSTEEPILFDNLNLAEYLVLMG